MNEKQMEKQKAIGRVEDELHELERRSEKLDLFIQYNKTFSELDVDEKALLLTQRDIMKSYATVLFARIALFKDKTYKETHGDPQGEPGPEGFPHEKGEENG